MGHVDTPPFVTGTLQLRRLSVTAAAGAAVLQAVDLSLVPGEVTVIVGPSGSGKSTIARALLGSLPAGLRRVAGELGDAGSWHDLARWPGRVALIPQDPVGSLDPLRRIGAALGDALRLAGTPDDRRQTGATALLRSVGIETPEQRLAHYPHELSGGQKQRVLIAMALAAQARIIVADEPTSALDVLAQRRVMAVLTERSCNSGAALLLITHDIGLAADYADRVVILDQGRVAEAGRAADVLTAPRSDIGRQLVAIARRRLAPPQARPAASAAAPAPLIALRDVTLDYRRAGQVRRGIAGVTLDIRPGETLALVGASGSGKSTLGRVILRLLTPDSGSLTAFDQDALMLQGRARDAHWRRIQPVYQNPDQALDPRWTVAQIIAEPLVAHGMARPQVAERVHKALADVGLDRALTDRRPATLSGGQRQRVAIARAMIGAPAVLVLDEALSALDLPVQDRILDLLDRLRRSHGLTYVFISHDLGAVRHFADRVAVLHDGRIVELGPVEQVLTRPSSPETARLLAAVPGAAGLLPPPSDPAPRPVSPEELP